MVPEQPTRNRIAELVQAIERQIVQRTWGRIHRLQVEAIGDRVVVHGYTQSYYYLAISSQAARVWLRPKAASYYSKQLALEGALGVIDDSTRLELDIDVATVPRKAHV
jgi:hypothetical protein